MLPERSLTVPKRLTLTRRLGLRPEPHEQRPGSPRRRAWRCRRAVDAPSRRCRGSRPLRGTLTEFPLVRVHPDGVIGATTSMYSANSYERCLHRARDLLRISRVLASPCSRRCENDFVSCASMLLFIWFAFGDAAIRLPKISEPSTMTPARAATHELRRVATLTGSAYGPRLAHDEHHRRGDRDGPDRLRR